MQKKDDEMICDKCKGAIKQGEEIQFQGQILCEDCHVDALFSVKACDPWAVHSAKSFSKKGGTDVEMTQTQSQILQILKETGGADSDFIADRLQITLPDLEREIATLRHMEKVSGELRAGKKIFRPW